LLSSGNVPNLYSKDDLEQRVVGEMRKPYKRDGQTDETPSVMTDWFFNRVKNNLHLSICMSPIGSDFLNYCKLYPALINNTTIDWFMQWPETALIEVAEKYLRKMDNSVPQECVEGLANFAGYAHSIVNEYALVMRQELRRVFHVTPTNFIELLKGYDRILKDKRKLVGDQITKLTNGLQKLDDARDQVSVMNADSETKRTEVSKETKEVEDLMLMMATE